MSVTKFDLQSENFDLFFEKSAENLTARCRAELPIDVLSKIKNNKLNFFTKIYIMWKCLRKRWWIIVEDEEKGQSADQFVAYRETIKKRDYSTPKAEGLVSKGEFFLANKEFGDTLQYLSDLSGSGAYRFIQRGKNRIVNKTQLWKEDMIAVTKVLVRYEGMKKKWLEEQVVTIPEFYVLMYLYPGEESVGSIMYHEVYYRSFQSSPAKIKLALGSLQLKGYIVKSGATRYSKFRITASGTDVVCSILTRYALNC